MYIEKPEVASDHKAPLHGSIKRQNVVSMRSEICWLDSVKRICAHFVTVYVT